MKKIKHALLLTISLFFFIMLQAKAEECTKEELKSLESLADKIEITYRHLGEVTKEDGNKAYNEFMVTAKNLDGFYVHLSPMTEENFIETEAGLQIKLTTGTWTYTLYSKNCDTKIKDIEVKLPKFNIYSLDPLCEGIDADDFSLCSKYYNYEFSRETFERKVTAYRKENKIDEVDSKREDKEFNIINTILNYLNKYYIYIIAGLALLLLIIILIIIVKKRRRRTVLE